MHNVTKLINKSFARYLLVGFISFIADYFSFLLMEKALNFDLAISVTVSLTIGLLVNFILNKFWTFSSTEKSWRTALRQLTLYLCLLGFNSVFSYWFIKFVEEQYKIDESFTKLVANGLIVLWNYAIYRSIVFKSSVVVKDVRISDDR